MVLIKFGPRARTWGGYLECPLDICPVQGIYPSWQRQLCFWKQKGSKLGLSFDYHSLAAWRFCQVSTLTRWAKALRFSGMVFNNFCFTGSYTPRNIAEALQRIKQFLQANATCDESFLTFKTQKRHINQSNQQASGQLNNPNCVSLQGYAKSWRRYGIF